MFYFQFLIGIVFVFENDSEKDSNYEGVGGENKPNIEPLRVFKTANVPSSDAVWFKPVFNHSSCNEIAEHCADTVGHQHKNALRRGLKFRICILLYKQSP